METLNITEVTKNFPALLEKVSHGEEIVITRHGMPVARITQCQEKAPEKKTAKRLGLYNGQIRIPDDWKDWSDEEARALGIID